ncbi:MAG: anti-sigma factor family protein [Gaiellaceae bacterium]
MNALRWLLTGSHAQIEGKMSDDLDGELTGLSRRRFHQHLAWCEGCSSMYECLRLTVEGLRSLGTTQPEPAPAMADAVLERIRCDAAHPDGQ